MKVFDGLTSLFRESEDDDYIEEDGYLEQEFDPEDDHKNKRHFSGSSESAESKESIRYAESAISEDHNRSGHSGKKKGFFSTFKKDRFKDERDDFQDDELEDYADISDDDPADSEYDRSYEKKTGEFQTEKKYSRPVRQSGTEARNVVPLRSTGGSKKMEVVVIRPNSMEDGSEITDTLLSGRAVVLNLEGISPDIAQHIIDYTAGSCYAMRGNLQKITNYIFLVTPSSVTISGDFQDVIGSGVDLGSFNGNFQF